MKNTTKAGIFAIVAMLILCIICLLSGYDDGATFAGVGTFITSLATLGATYNLES